MEHLRKLLTALEFSLTDIEAGLDGSGRFGLLPLRFANGPSLRVVYDTINEARRLGLHVVHLCDDHRVIAFEEAVKLRDAINLARLPRDLPLTVTPPSG